MMTRPANDTATRPMAASLAARLFVAIGLILAAGGTIVTLAAFAYGQQAARDAFDRLLIGAANQISASMSVVDGEVRVDLPVSALELLALAREDRVFYRVVDSAGETITGYDGLPVPDFEGDLFRFDGTFTGEEARFAAVNRHFTERGFSGTVTTIVGHTRLARDALAWGIARNAWLVMGIAGLGMIALATFSIRSALAPLGRIERELLRRDPNDLTPVNVAVPREIFAVVGAINRFMMRLSRQIDGMQNLISDSAHQLRTPIAALRAQADLAAGETNPEEQARIVGRIHKRSIDLSRLTDQMLNRALVFHRADTAMHHPLDLRKLAVDAAETFDDGRLFETGQLHLDLPPRPIMIKGDALSIGEAIKNFINNGFTHGDGPVTVRVGETDGMAVVAVRDTGSGLSATQLAKLGERFSSAGSSAKHGSGIGLSIARAVARSHDGKITVTSPPDGGFEIILALPSLPEQAV